MTELNCFGGVVLIWETNFTEVNFKPFHFIMAGLDDACSADTDCAGTAGLVCDTTCKIGRWI